MIRWFAFSVSTHPYSGTSVIPHSRDRKLHKSTTLQSNTPSLRLLQPSRGAGIDENSRPTIISQPKLLGCLTPTRNRRPKSLKWVRPPRNDYLSKGTETFYKFYSQDQKRIKSLIWGEDLRDIEFEATESLEAKPQRPRVIQFEKDISSPATRVKSADVSDVTHLETQESSWAPRRFGSLTERD
ncbi:hypothetical protein NPIL_137251 [Nephila pilipes]|uniref:Uncharacterized protein n=1 Tax=Nephila pilipes TaxID=299642 RepID=A0A8X6M5Z5_NEPPI|nr:hypothetical protein NPIL_137251 [Nephila pilipes]